jgi:hypothetical protein
MEGVVAVLAAGTRSRSSVVERFLGKEEVTGSIPVASSMGKEGGGAGGSRWRGNGEYRAQSRWSRSCGMDETGSRRCVRGKARRAPIV